MVTAAAVTQPIYHSRTESAVHWQAGGAKEDRGGALGQLNHIVFNDIVGSKNLSFIFNDIVALMCSLLFLNGLINAASLGRRTHRDLRRANFGGALPGYPPVTEAQRWFQKRSF